MESAEQTLPTLLYLLSAMSAMGFLLSSYLWLWRVSNRENKQDFKSSIYKGQLYAFLSVMVLSICIGSYDHFIHGRDLFIGGEIFVLVTALAYAYVKAGDQNKVGHVLSSKLKALSFGFFCIFGWGLTIVLGIALTYLFQALGLSNNGGVDSSVVFITGLSWNVPIVILYAYIVRNPNTKAALKGGGFHKFLWPVLMAYTVLLIPLLIQQISVSEEWQKMKNEKPMKTV